MRGRLRHARPSTLFEGISKCSEAAPTGLLRRPQSPPSRAAAGANGASGGQCFGQPATAGFVAERSVAVQAQVSHTRAQRAPSGGADSAAREAGFVA